MYSLAAAVCAQFMCCPETEQQRSYLGFGFDIFHGHLESIVVSAQQILFLDHDIVIE